MKALIVNADDFGIAPEVNEAIERAHVNGILCSASLMVGAPAADDAIARARRLPGLAVGLHLVLVYGRPVLPPERVPDLVDERGEFPTNLARAGVRYFFRPAARKQIETEIRAQFERFAASGLALDHVNAQCHMHVHPTIFDAILRVGREFGMRAIRIPNEPVGAAYRARNDRLGTRLGYATVTGPWVARMRARARRAGIFCNDAAFGVNDAGAMTEPRVLRLLESLPNGATEMLFHPATRPFDGADPVTEDYAWQGELSALVSPRVRQMVDEQRIRLATYG
ncbi:MAG: hopanoid biosynthesis-associated protein HpnK, partial [Candidatus Eremiobacteraeota bacterium]|nr:hopanoid biosynthesis-associated protein HpnK [Candidatus Eremiobacteraeota bacterium]